MYRKLFESLDAKGFRPRRLNRIVESINIKQKKLMEAINADKLNEEDVVGTVTDIVKSLADLQVTESEEVIAKIEEQVDKIEESDDEDVIKESAEEVVDIVDDLLEAYDVKTMEENVDDKDKDEIEESEVEDEEETIIENTEFTFGEADEEDDKDDLNESDCPESLTDIKIGKSETEQIEENKELEFDKLEEDASEAVADVEEIIEEINDTDKIEEQEDLTGELKEAIAIAEDAIDTFEKSIDEDDKPVIEYVNEMRNTIARAKVISESEEDYVKYTENADTKGDVLDEETEKDIENITEAILGESEEELTKKELAEDAIQDIKALKESLEVLDESEKGEAPFTKDELDEMEDKLTTFVESEDEVVDEDEIDDIIKNISESTDTEDKALEEQEKEIIAEGINSLFKQLGFKTSQRKEFNSLFEMAVTSGVKKVQAQMQKRSDQKLRKLAEGYVQMAVATGKQVLIENKQAIKGKLYIEESAKANRLITESLNKHGYFVESQSTSNKLRKTEKLLESKENEIKQLSDKITTLNSINESNQLAIIVDKVAKDRNLSLNESVKLKQLTKSLTGNKVNENEVAKISRMFFKENRKSNYTQGRTTKQTINESKPAFTKENTVTQPKTEHQTLVETVLNTLKR